MIHQVRGVQIEFFACCPIWFNTTSYISGLLNRILHRID